MTPLQRLLLIGTCLLPCAVAAQTAAPPHSAPQPGFSPAKPPTPPKPPAFGFKPALPSAHTAPLCDAAKYKAVLQSSLKAGFVIVQILPSGALFLAPKKACAPPTSVSLTRGLRAITDLCSQKPPPADPPIVFGGDSCQPAPGTRRP